jgi:hypothetical protein
MRFLLLCCIGSAHGFTAAPRQLAPARGAHARSPAAVLGLKTQAAKLVIGIAVPAAATFFGVEFLKQKQLEKDAKEGRAALASMGNLADLNSMSLDKMAGDDACVERGDWKQYTKRDGRKWYYNTETKSMQWAIPDEFKTEFKGLDNGPPTSAESKGVLLEDD